jgi:hypothetical protein
MSLGSQKQDIKKVAAEWPISHKYVFLRKGSKDELSFYFCLGMASMILFSVGRGLFRCITGVKEEKN